MGTIQLDFQIPQKFGLKYTGKDGKEKTPVVIHRVIYGSLERFIGILIEHYAGAFPVWLSPTQVRVLALSQKYQQYAEEVADALKTAGTRVVLTEANETLGKRIREAETQKIPYILIVGEKEKQSSSVAVRKRGEGDIGVQKLSSFVGLLVKDIPNHK